MAGTIKVGGKTIATHDESTDVVSLASDVDISDVDMSNTTFPAGHIIQMTTNTMDMIFAITETTNMYEILSCSITPAFDTSKIIINITVHLWHTNYNTGKLCIFRDTTRIGIGTDTTATFGGSSGEYGIGIRCGQYSPATTDTGRSWAPNPYTLIHVDTPGTSGTPITYYLKGVAGQDSNFPLYVNRGSDVSDSPRPVSTITLLEVMA